MTCIGQIYKFIEANRSLEKLVSQNNEYPIKTAYKLIITKKLLDEAIDYVMSRFTDVCGGNVDFENLTDSQNAVLNEILSQDMEIELPDINPEDIFTSEKITVSTTDVENILYLLRKNN